MKAPSRARQLVRQRLFSWGGVERLHIIGAARSGTTMLHYAMAAFEGTVLYPREINPAWMPGLATTARYAIGRLWRGSNNITYVTKRFFGWHKEHYVVQLIDQARDGGLGLILLVRDPRDTLTSLHANASGEGYYLDLPRWQSSAKAGEAIFEALSEYPNKLKVRYEDLVNNPARVQQEIAETFGLRLRPQIRDWSDLPSYIDQIPIDGVMAKALHQIRAFDPGSIGKWQFDSLRRAYWERIYASEEYRSDLDEFMRRCNYGHNGGSECSTATGNSESESNSCHARDDH